MFKYTWYLHIVIIIIAYFNHVMYVFMRKTNGQYIYIYKKTAFNEIIISLFIMKINKWFDSCWCYIIDYNLNACINNKYCTYQCLKL